MEIDDFIEKFKDGLHNTSTADINATTRFKKLEEWSSIFALIVIAMVDAEYGRVLTTDDIQSSDTLEDLFRTIQSK